MADQIQESAFPFAHTASRLASDYDVLMCYQLLLGRDPENSFVIQEAKTQPLRRIFEGFVRSKEFTDKVSLPFVQGGLLAHETDSLGPSAEQLAWLRQVLTLTRKTASAITAARNWRALLAILFTLPGFTPTAHPAPSQLLGAINSLTGSRVSGWCLDVAGSGAVVTLAMLADGDVMGHCECQLPRPDVQAALGGDGRCGFEFEIPKSRRGQAFVLSAQDAKSGTAVLGPLHIPASLAALSAKVAVLQDRIDRLDTLMHPPARHLSEPASPQTAGGAERTKEGDRIVAGV